MVAWVWVAVATIIVVALQAFLFHRARRNWGVSGDGSVLDVDVIESSGAQESGSPERTDSGVRCPHCGQHNADAFTFCQRCVQPLR